jgi:hypothetical protein
MNKSREVKSQIVKEYTYEGSYYTPNIDDIMRHLVADNIDSGVEAIHSIVGFDISDDRSLGIFSYDDGSSIIVGNGGIQ